MRTELGKIVPLFHTLTYIVPMKKFIVPLVLCIHALTATVVAQENLEKAASEERLTVETADKDSAAAKGIESPVKTTPLPAGYKAVIEKAQEEKIRAIQKDYQPLIARLKERIALLEKERNTKIEAILTAAQKDKIKNRPRIKRTAE